MTSGAEAIVSLYERHAAAWARIRRSSHFIEAEWMRRFRALLSPGCTILDVGCGSGRPIAQYFIENDFKVVGVDTSGSLIDRCRSDFPDHRWIVADMRTLALSRKFQGVVAWDSFFHLSHDHQRNMFGIFRDHAAEGAALIFTSGTAHGEALGTFEGECLYHASLSANEYQELLERHGFHVIRHEVEDPHCGGRTVWLAQLAHGETRRLIPQLRRPGQTG